MSRLFKPKGLLLLVFVTLLVANCEDHLPEPEENPIKGSFTSLAQDGELRRMVTDLRGSNRLASTANSEEYDVFADADWDHVSKLEDTRPDFNRTLYATPLKSTMSGRIVENLIMTEVDGKKIQFIMRYKSEEDWFLYNSLTEDMHSFTGTIEFVTLEGSIFAKSAFSNGESYIPNRGSSADDCNTWVTTEYSDVQYTGDGPWDNTVVYWTVSEYVWCETAIDPLEVIAPGDESGAGGGDAALPISDISHLQRPCPGNPLPAMEIAEQKTSGVNGGRFGMTRTKQLESGAIVPKPHRGLDLKTNYGAPIYSMFAGTVVAVNYEGNGLGHYIVVKSLVNGRYIHHYYGHLQTPSITVGTVVQSGGLIGKSGSSGNLGSAVKKGTTEQHLHIIIRDSDKPDRYNHPNGAKVNPEDFLTSQFDANGNRTDSQLDCQDVRISTN